MTTQHWVCFQPFGIGRTLVDVDLERARSVSRLSLFLLVPLALSLVLTAAMFWGPQSTAPLTVIAAIALVLIGTAYVLRLYTTAVKRSHKPASVETLYCTELNGFILYVWALVLSPWIYLALVLSSPG